MSLSSEIRTVLRSAPGPLTAREVREELGDKYTAEQVGSNLSSLTKFGELIRDGELGKFTYLLDPKFKPKRQRDDAAAVPPPYKEICRFQSAPAGRKTGDGCRLRHAQSSGHNHYKRANGARHPTARVTAHVGSGLHSHPSGTHDCRAA